MARAGRKRKLKPREPSGRIKKAHRDPLHEWTLAPIEQLTKREAILGSKSARGEISEPFAHLRFHLDDAQIASAERFRLHWDWSRMPGGPNTPKNTLGAQQARGAISSFTMPHDERAAYFARLTSDAMNSMTPKPREVVELLTGYDRPMFNSQGCNVAWFRQNLSRHLASYKLGLNQLSRHYGFDKVAKSGVWVAE